MLGIFDNYGSHNPYPVASGGFLLGSQTTLVLFGLHVSQIARYYHRFGKEDKRRYRFLLVPLVFTISAAHIAVVCTSMYHYFVRGIIKPEVWGYFYWGLSAQDFIIPMISAVAHIFFSWRVTVLAKIKRLYWYFFLVFVIFTLGVGIAFAALARLWSHNPWVTEEQYEANPYGGPADVLPTVWLSCAAAIDGCITASLLYILLREGSITKHARRLTSRVIALTLETVLLTHIIGATLFVLWLTSRTRTNAFWFLIEIISETYSLSILFTLNSRARFRKAAKPDSNEMIDNQLRAMRRPTPDLEDQSSRERQHSSTFPSTDTPGESSSSSERKYARSDTKGSGEASLGAGATEAYEGSGTRVFLPSLSKSPLRHQTSYEMAEVDKQEGHTATANARRKTSLPTPRL